MNAPEQGFAPSYQCTVCGHADATPDAKDLGVVRGNTARYKSTLFHLWKCPECESIASVDPVEFAEIYAEYPLNVRRLDAFAKKAYRNLLCRLEREGVKSTDSILDYGCGNGVFVQFLRELGFTQVQGYDPYVAEYASKPELGAFDVVVANDVIEHAPDPAEVVRDCVALLRPGGILYLGTADSDGVEMTELEPHVMRLHQPFHRVIVNERSLRKLGDLAGLACLASYRRSYMDTLKPFVNYRFLDEFNAALGHDLDKAMDPSAGSIVMKRPRLFFFGLFGYFFPSAAEPAIVWRKS